MLYSKGNGETLGMKVNNQMYASERLLSLHCEDTNKGEKAEAGKQKTIDIILEINDSLN